MIVILNKITKDIQVITLNLKSLTMVLNEDIPKVYKENMEKFGQEINPLLLVEKIKEWCES